MRSNLAFKPFTAPSCAALPGVEPRTAAAAWIHPLATAPARAPASPLTDRQLECLRWISQGKSSTDIGVILRISGRTVDYHVIAICERLGVRTRTQAVAQAIQRGWLSAG